MRTFWYAGWLLLTGIVLFACQTGDLNVGQSVINPQELVIQSIDTVTIQTSTVLKVDSFATSTDTDIMVGRWTDSQTGTLTAKAFGALDFSSNPIGGQTNLRLDSLVFEMNYSFVYGDSTSLFDMSIYPLKKAIVPQVYYSTNSLDYDATPMARMVVQPRPLSRGRQIRFRMSDNLAQDFYNRLLTNQITDYTSLGRFLPGFAFVSNSTNNTLAGFSASTTPSGLTLYYHTTDDPQTALNVKYPVTSLHFTQLQNDRSGTALSALKGRSDAVNSRLTDNTSFIALGSFLQTRIEFPYLGQFALPDKFADVNKALLVINTTRRSLRDNATPPSPIQLFQTNRLNQAIAVVPDGTTGIIQSGASSAAAGYFANTQAEIFTDAYTFDLTYYIGQILKRKSSNEPLLLTTLTPSSGLMKVLAQRVALGNAYRTGDQMQLKLFLTSGS
ncbi:DUF4270 family protein [Spirosoma koreense]